MPTTEEAYRRRPLKRLTDRENLFVEEYVSDPNATKAAIAAGYSKRTASVTGSQLLKRPHVAAAIGVLQRHTREQFEIERYEILSRLAFACTRDPADFLNKRTGKLLPLRKMSKAARSCIDQLDIDPKTGKVIGIRLMSLATALDLAMKHKGLFAPDQHQHLITPMDFDLLIQKAQSRLDPNEQLLLEEERKATLVTTATTP
jgi:phage terminase small subunit